MEGARKRHRESLNTGEGARPIPSAESFMLEDTTARSLRLSRNLASFSSSLDSFSAASRKLSRFCRGTGGSLSLQEILKEKQAQYKEARENRKAKVDASYKYIFEVLSIRLGLDLETVEEMILDAPSLEAFSSFFAKKGSKALKIFYQEGEAPGIECGRTIPGVAKGSKMMQLYVDDTPDKFIGKCFFFVRFKNDNRINVKTIHEDIFFGVLDATEGLLRGVKNMIQKIFLPAILKASNWGALSQSKQDTKTKQNFVETIKRYISFLEGAMISIEGTVELEIIDYVNFSKLHSFEKVAAAANNPDEVHQLEEVLMIWYRQIEQVLIESKQMRREADDSGPLTELQNWKCVSAKLNSIIEQIKGQNCKAVINVLNVGHSKILRMWRELEARITDAANEAKDNVKYLGILEKVCQPLYNYDLVSMTHAIPNLVNAIQMIHRVSRYYNTSERMTSLFIKVTNQMVTSCRAYITNSGLTRVWDQETSTVIGKIKDCTFLLKEYQKCFHETKQEILETLGEKSFEVSEIYIFGQSEAFCRRLEKITEMITIVQTFNSLSLSSIEGVDIMAVGFKNIYQSVQKKQYDILDPRKPDFDVDFVDFLAKVEGLEMQIQTFMHTCFGRILSSQHALQLLQRFQELKLTCLQEETVHAVGCILRHYVAELESTEKRYQIQKNDPPLGRNMPPVAGRIMWVRQLFRRINEPINYFHKNSNILASPEGKAVVQLYNKIAYLLVEFEVVYHEAWKKEISQLQYPLQATIFLHHPGTGKFLVNFDPKIPEIVRETKCMMKLGLQVPEQAIKIVKIENKLMSNKLRLEGLLRCYEDLCQKTPTSFVNLMAPKMNKMETVLRQGLTMLTWSSVTLESFFREADQVLCMFKEFLKKVSDLSEEQIFSILREISNTLLIVLPVEDPIKVEDMLTSNEAYTKDCAELLNHKSMHIESAVQELISLFKQNYEIEYPEKTSESPILTVKEKRIVFGDNENESEKSTSAPCHDKEDEFKKKSKELVAYFSYQLLDSLQKATRLSLDSLKTRIFVSNKTTFGRTKLSAHSSKSQEVASLLKVELHLAVPNVIMVPSLDDIQKAINRMIQLILEVNRGVAHWGQKHLQKSRLKPGASKQQLSSAGLPGQVKKKKEEGAEGVLARKLRNFYSGVSEHEDVSKLVMLLSSSVNSLREVASEVLKDFQKYKVLWTEDRDEKVQQFFASCPSLTEIKEEILRYAKLEEEMKNLNPTIPLGPIELHTGPLQTALAVEAKTWKMLLCHYLNEKYKKKMTDMMSFITEYLKKMSRPLRDLDDVRFATEALSVIRDTEIEVDMTLGPIEEAYAILNTCEIKVTKEELEGVDSLRYSFKKLQKKATRVQDELLQVQPKFKTNLLESVTVFQEDVSNFEISYETEGPMVPNIPPQEASNRLQIFQANFDDLWRKFITYSSGEHLFGLPVTEYPVLRKVRKELGLLQKLYGLYDSVMNSIKGYYEILWTDVDIEKINAELLDFQNSLH